jgi:biotin carboxylase
VSEEFAVYLVVVDPHYALYRYHDTAKAKGLDTIALHTDAKACREQELRYRKLAGVPRDGSAIDKIIECNVYDADAVLAALRPFADQIVGMVAGNEDAVPSCAKAAAALGFEATSPEDADCLHDKRLMKQRFVDHGVTTARFRTVATFDEALAVFNELGGDCMLKVADSNSSAHVHRAVNETELRHVWHSMLEAKVAGPYVLEEHVGGDREISVEGYNGPDGVVFLNACEKFTSKQFVVIGHYVPALIEPDILAATQEQVAKCVKALGINNSVFHCEVHIRDGVPFVIECAGRPPGQFITDLIADAYDIDLTSVAIDLATGKDPQVVPVPPNHWFAQLTVFARDSGTYTGIANLEELRARGGVRSLSTLCEPGDRIEALTNFAHRYGVLVLEGATAEEVRERAAWAKENVYLLTEAT